MNSLQGVFIFAIIGSIHLLASWRRKKAKRLQKEIHELSVFFTNEIVVGKSIESTKI